MNQPDPFGPGRAASTPSRPRLHPLLSAAAICVIVFCAVAVAAVVGWIPSPWAKNGAPVAAAPASSTGTPTAAAQGPSAAGAAAEGQAATGGASAAAARPAERVAQAGNAAATCASCGVVQEMRAYKVSKGEPMDSNRIIGTVGGGVVGGVVGNQFGGGHGKDALTVIGAVGGALAGREIQRNMQQPQTVTRYELTVRMDNGETRKFRSESPYAFASGDHVRVENGAVRPR